MSTENPSKPSREDRKKPKAPKKEKKQIVDDELLEDEAGENKFLLFNVMPSWMTSFIAHVVLILLMAFLIMPTVKDKTVSFEASEVSTENLDAIDLNLDADLDISEDVLDNEVTEEIVDLQEEFTPVVDVEVPVENFNEVDLTSEIFNASETLSESLDVGAVSEVESRSGAAKDRLLQEYGGSAASEKSVALALQWIIKHQLEDGGWNFDHTIGSGDRSSGDPGEYSKARIAATAMALLPLLGSGQTHQAGKYKKEIQRGLEFMISRGTLGQNGAVSFHERPQGTMYSHGLAAIVFAEAFALTEDTQIAPFAQGAIWFIEQFQDPVGGGWYYHPQAPGDTSVSGWQVMALKSAKLSGLQVNKKTIKLIDKFLNNVSIENGAKYGYKTAPIKTERRTYTLSSVGLLCRMYLGWDKDHPGLKAGVDFLSERGPDVKGDRDDIYYNYYGTQVMKQYGGEQWKRWNGKLRDHLVKTQVKTKGAEEGSWMFHGGHGTESGGRLYSTAMACMTLEVYYRYLPLYTTKATEEAFPLD